MLVDTPMGQVTPEPTTPVEAPPVSDDPISSVPVAPVAPTPLAPAPAPVAPTPAPAPVRREAPAPEPEPAREKTFTQAELDDRVGKARHEGRASAYRYLGKELSVAVVTESGEIDLSGLRGLVEEARTKRASNDDSLRAALDRLNETEARAAEKDAEVRGATARAQQMLRRGEAKAAAIQLGFNDPADALLQLGDLSRFPADLETQTVDGLTDALTAIAAQKPYLLRSTETPPPPPISTPTPSPTDPAKQQLADDEERREIVRAQARAFF